MMELKLQLKLLWLCALAHSNAVAVVDWESSSRQGDAIRAARAASSRDSHGLLRREEFDDVGLPSPLSGLTNASLLEVTKGTDVPIRVIGHLEDLNHGWETSAGALIYKIPGINYGLARFDPACNTKVSREGKIYQKIATRPNTAYRLIFQASFQASWAAAAEAYVEFDGLKKRFVTTALSNHETGSINRWESFQFSFVASGLLTMIAFGEDIPMQCVAVREILLAPDESKMVPPDAWRGETQLMSMLMRTGCPNLEASMVDEGMFKKWRVDLSQTQDSMFEMCEQVTRGVATDLVHDACCGRLKFCRPKGCKRALVNEDDEEGEEHAWTKWMSLGSMRWWKRPWSGKQHNLNYWQVRFDYPLDMRAIRVKAQVSGVIGPFTVMLDKTICAQDVLIAGEQEILCDGQGKILRIRAQKPGPLHLDVLSYQLVGATRQEEDIAGTCPMDIGFHNWDKSGRADLDTGMLGSFEYLESKQQFEGPFVVTGMVRQVGSIPYCYSDSRTARLSRDHMHAWWIHPDRLLTPGAKGWKPFRYSQPKTRRTLSGSLVGKLRIVSDCRVLQLKDVFVTDGKSCASPTRSCFIDVPYRFRSGIQLWTGKIGDIGDLQEKVTSTLMFSRPFSVRLRVRLFGYACVKVSLLGNSIQVGKDEIRMQPGNVVKRHTGHKSQELPMHALVAIRIFMHPTGRVKFFVNGVHVHESSASDRTGTISVEPGCVGAHVRVEHFKVRLFGECERDSQLLQGGLVETVDKMTFTP
eukprot:TRINITY_DN14746_c0_g1_i1.p1 TRINITY_DN14746_c0_g1~~TRINITY_DN14746_c0_g1_i1.p1  ORF type:complete len:753 (-),score=79.22 TRINITY_DN14746_c0_g1_i1:43-2301(-)